MEGGNSEKELRSVSSFVLDISAKAITSPRFDRGELNEKEKNGRGGGGRNLEEEVKIEKKEIRGKGNTSWRVTGPRSGNYFAKGGPILF